MERVELGLKSKARRTSVKKGEYEYYGNKEQEFVSLNSDLILRSPRISCDL